jgi:tetraacyldisaccharide 4'-kinase
LADRGERPVVILRGYGIDEPEVHKTLNPDIPVLIGADRVAAVTRAASMGATIAVLDDAFQHRRMQRVADIVLVSADRWTGSARLLPAGPWREPIQAIRRATVVVVTRKAASDKLVNDVHEYLARIAPTLPRVSVRLEPSELVRADGSGERRSLETVSGLTAQAILSIADPHAFTDQLRSLGAVVNAITYPDHHEFTAEEVTTLAARFAEDDLVLCTLKDSVKLAPLWPRLAPPLWYVSQRVMVERGVGGLERVLDGIARTPADRSEPGEVR